MHTFNQLRRFRAYFESLPGIKTCKDFDIAIEIGHYQQLGQPLTMKQLLLLNLAPPATLRRHLDRMIKNGTVIKHASKTDHRTVYFTLSKRAILSFQDCLEHITLVLSQAVGEEEAPHRHVG